MSSWRGCSPPGRPVSSPRGAICAALRDEPGSSSGMRCVSPRRTTMAAGSAVTLPGLVGVGETVRVRVQALGPARADALLAVAVAAAGIVPILLIAPARQVPGALAIVLVQAVGLAYRRRRPLFGWCLGFGVIVPVTFLPMPVNDVLIAAFVGVIFASYSLGANLEDGRGWWVVAAVGVAATIAHAVYAQTTDSKLSDVVWG